MSLADIVVHTLSFTGLKGGNCTAHHSTLHRTMPSPKGRKPKGLHANARKAAVKLKLTDMSLPALHALLKARKAKSQHLHSTRLAPAGINGRKPSGTIAC